MANDQDSTSKAAGIIEESCCVEFEKVVNDLDSLLRKLEASSSEPVGSHNSRLQLLELRSAVLELDLFNRKLEDLCEDLVQTKYGLEQMTDTATAELHQGRISASEDEPLAGRHHKLLIDESVHVQQSISKLREEVAAAQRHLLAALRQTSVGVFNMAAAVSTANAAKISARERVSAHAEQAESDSTEPPIPPPDDAFGPIVSSFIS